MGPYGIKENVKTKNPKEDNLESDRCLSSLPITVEKIKLESDDPTAKFPSKKSKRKSQSESEPQEIPAFFPVAVENIKFEKDADSPSLSIMTSQKTKSKKIRLESVDVEVPIISKIKLERENNPSKRSSRKSKKINLEEEPQDIAAPFPIPVENMKLEKGDRPFKKSKNIKQEEDDVVELLKPFPGPVEIIKLEQEEDPPTKNPSKMSKRIRLEQERQGSHSTLPIPIEKIKLEKEDPPSKKSKKIRQDASNAIELLAKLPVPVEKIKLEKDDPPSKSSSKKSKKNKSELVPEEVSSSFPIPVKNIKLEKEDVHSQKSRKSRQQTDHLAELPSPLPIPVEKIKLEKDDPPSKSSSKKSKKNKSELVPEEVPSSLLIPVENIKLGEADLDEIVYMRFTAAPESIKIEKDDDVGETETAVSEKRSKKRKNKSKETQPAELDSESKTTTLLPCKWLYTCKIKGGSCGVSFWTAENLERHLENVHSQFTCVRCGKKFSKAEILDQHMGRAHHMFECVIPECEGYCTPSKMRTHVKKNHGFPCNICNRKFRSQRRLANHLRDVHAEIKEYTCKVCQQTYQSKFQDEVGATRNHLIRKCPVPGAESFPCEKCQFVASTTKERNDHDCRPTERRVKCFYPDCGDLFANQQKLNIHRSTANHWMSIRYTCFCKLQFPTMEALRTHRDYEHVLGCNFGDCTRTFLKRQGLKSHVKSVHKGILIPLVYSCKLCEIPFKYKTSFEDHIDIAHDDYNK